MRLQYERHFWHKNIFEDKCLFLISHTRVRKSSSIKWFRWHCITVTIWYHTNQQQKTHALRCISTQYQANLRKWMDVSILWDHGVSQVRSDRRFQDGNLHSTTVPGLTSRALKGSTSSAKWACFDLNGLEGASYTALKTDSESAKGVLQQSSR